MRSGAGEHRRTALDHGRDRLFGKSSGLTVMTIRIGTSERDGTFYSQGRALKTMQADFVETV